MTEDENKPAPEEQPSATEPPAEAQPAEAQPAEAQPAEAQPAEAQPAEAQPAEAQPAKPERPAEGMVTCALTGKEIPAQEAYWAPPLITVGQLVSTIGVTLVKTPSNLGHVLFEELPEVPYAPEAREELASRRTAEQLKLLGGLVVVLAVIIGVIYLIFS